LSCAAAATAMAASTIKIKAARFPSRMELLQTDLPGLEKSMPDLFYKSRSQEKKLSRGRKFSYFAAHVNERDLF
jgi:hypothetical protein